MHLERLYDDPDIQIAQTQTTQISASGGVAGMRGAFAAFVAVFVISVLCLEQCRGDNVVAHLIPHSHCDPGPSPACCALFSRCFRVFMCALSRVFVCVYVRVYGF